MSYLRSCRTGCVADVSSTRRADVSPASAAHGARVPALRLAVLLFATLAAAQCAIAGPDKLILTGNDQALWLVRVVPNDQDARQSTFDVVAMTPGGKWQSVAGDLRGSAKVCAASQRWLHVLQDKPGYLIFDLPKSSAPTAAGESPSVGLATDDPHWPSDASPVAAYSADSFYSTALAAQESPTTAPSPAATPLPSAHGPAKTASASATTAPYQTIIVIVEHPALPPTTQPATLPADNITADRPQPDWPNPMTPGTRPAPALASRPSQLVTRSVFVNLGDKWQYLTDMPPLPRGQEIQCTVFHGELYVMLSSHFRDPMMLAWDKQTWRTVKLPLGLDKTIAIAMVHISDRLVVVLSGPTPTTGPAQASQHRVRLLISSPTGAFDIPPQPLTLAGRPMPPIDTPPLASRLGSRIAILWAHDNTFNFGTCGLDCVIPSIETVDVLASAKQQEHGQQLMKYFTIAILVVIFIPLLLFRAKAPPQLFSLPPAVVPGNLVKRALAAAIDFAPFVIASSIVFAVHIEQLTLLSQQDSDPPLNLVYAYVITFSLYIAYCAIMEAICGATLGKLLLGLKVVCDLGVKVTIREAIIRNAIKAVELQPPFMPLLLVMLINHNRRRFGDLVAKTAVVEARSLPPKGTPTDAPPGDQQNQAAQAGDATKTNSNDQSR